MPTTANLQLPYLTSHQSQKHVTLNESLRMLDVLVQTAVVTAEANTPPGSPADGACFLVGLSPSGDWAEQSGALATFVDGGWRFFQPLEGWRFWDLASQTLKVFSAGTWVDAITAGGQLGIGASPDDTNRLALSSPASLFNHAGAGHQLKLNKAASTDTVSLLFQQAFSGRAEFGLTGDEHFRIKMSPDGSAWDTAFYIQNEAGDHHGYVGVGTSTPEGPLHVSSSDARIVLEDLTGTGDPDAGWEVISRFDPVTLGSNLRFRSRGAGFGSAGVAIDIEKDATGTGRIGLFQYSAPDAILALGTNLSASGSDGVRFTFNNTSSSGTAVFNAAYTNASDPNARTSSKQVAFAATNNTDTVFSVDMGGTLSLGGHIQMNPVTASELPGASTVPNAIFLLDTGGGGRAIAISNGADWTTIS
ncbi:MAG: DUF2793 domain-containing protein [Pseudomonadota bacterium]